MELNDFLTEFGKMVGLSELNADEESHCSISVDDMVIHFQGEPLRDVVLIHGDVGELPPGCSDAFYRAVLEMNYLFAGTRGATLSLKPESDILELAIMLPFFSTQTMQQLLKYLEVFVNSLETLRKFVADYRDTAATRGVSTQAQNNLPENIQGVLV